ncbi:MAG: carboxypeptidase-like regulatory domain-containing protein [Bryobacteraceae bacterium]
MPAQSTPTQPTPTPSSSQAVVSAAEPAEQDGGRIYGTVKDSAGNVVTGATVTLQLSGSNKQRTLLTQSTGFFNFTGLAPGNYQVTIASQGFAPWARSEIVLTSGQYYDLLPIQLEIASASTSVRVVFSSHDLAEEQVKVEERQRVLGIVPNFYTSYVWDAEPLSSKQKFRLAWRSSIDPIAFLGSGVVAGVEQWQNNFKGYGQGTEGYAKRYGASYADGFIGTMIGGAILPSVLHQDPRYFYKGTGSIRSRALYAISTVVICKGDNGHWQPNYSSVLGDLAAAGISNIYYPSSDRGAVTIDNALIGTATGAVGALLQEFLIRKISRGVPPSK